MILSSSILPADCVAGVTAGGAESLLCSDADDFDLKWRLSPPLSRGVSGDCDAGRGMFVSREKDGAALSTMEKTGTLYNIVITTK